MNSLYALPLKLTAICCILCLTGCPSKPKKATALVSDPATIERDINSFCGACHAAPDPATFAKQHWKAEVDRGFAFYYESKRTDLKEPDRVSVVKYYEERAPERLRLPDPGLELASGPLRFSRDIAETDELVATGVSHLEFVDGQLLFTDMSTGTIGNVQLSRNNLSTTSLGKLDHPSHVDLVDLDGDGTNELIASDLGTFSPQDHKLGKLVRIANAATTPEVLLENVGRIAGTAPADFDGDGNMDIAVAEFGWRSTGKLHVILQSDKPEKRWQDNVVADQHGHSHVVAMDIDGDDDMDMVALQSQEYETVWCYENDGTANFTKHVLFAAPVPDYGCSCIACGDVDGDGDLDVVLSNGDSMDSRLLKPHHAIQWIENLGNWKFEHHSVGKLPGAYGVDLADMDSDGDLDIVACAMTWWDDIDFNTIVWFEQKTDKSFEQHCLDLSTDQHACLATGDFDTDGDVDIAIGEFDRSGQSRTWVTVWWNDGPTNAQAAGYTEP